MSILAAGLLVAPPKLNAMLSAVTTDTFFFFFFVFCCCCFFVWLWSNWVVHYRHLLSQNDNWTAAGTKRVLLWKIFVARNMTGVPKSEMFFVLMCFLCTIYLIILVNRLQSRGGYEGVLYINKEMTCFASMIITVQYCTNIIKYMLYNYIGFFCFFFVLCFCIVIGIFLLAQNDQNRYVWQILDRF